MILSVSVKVCLFLEFDFGIDLRKIEDILNREPEIARNLIRKRERRGVLAHLDGGDRLPSGANRKRQLLLRYLPLLSEFLDLCIQFYLLKRAKPALQLR